MAGRLGGRGRQLAWADTVEGVVREADLGIIGTVLASDAVEVKVLNSAR
jgi:hypothetical protein